MNFVPCPCYGCDKRKVGCHSTCPAYTEYSEYCASRREERAMRMKADAADIERGEKIRRDVRQNGLYGQRRHRR